MYSKKRGKDSMVVPGSDRYDLMSERGDSLTDFRDRQILNPPKPSPFAQRNAADKEQE